MLETGMRCGEVYQLRRQDVNLAQGYVKVTKGKTKASVRQVPLSVKAREIVRYRLAKFADYLFPRQDQDAPTGRLKTEAIAKIAKAV